LGNIAYVNAYVNYGGDLKFNRTITVDGKDWKASDWVKTPHWGRSAGAKRPCMARFQWYFTPLMLLTPFIPVRGNGLIMVPVFV
jgi:hypothetical protein